MFLLIKSIIRAAVQLKFLAPEGDPSIGEKYSLIPEARTKSMQDFVSDFASSVKPYLCRPSIISQLVLIQVGPCQ